MRARALHRLSTIAYFLRVFLSIPGLLLLAASAGLSCAAVDREQAAHDLALDRECL